jgi:hypothetical protein
MSAMSRRAVGLATAWLLAAALVAPVGAPAADLTVVPEQKEPQVAPAAPGPLAPVDATCTEWTDGCRTCVRSDKGEVSCSNVGIACVQQAPHCTAKPKPAETKGPT